MRNVRLFVASVLAAVALPPAVTRAETPDGTWRFEIAPYVWATSLNGDVGSRGRSVSVDADFADIVHDSDSLLAAMLHMEVGRGRWSAFTDVTYGKIGVDDVFTANGFVDTTSTTLWIEGGGAYRFIDEQPLGASDSKSRVTVDGLLGARVSVIGFDLRLKDVGIDVDQTTAWVDPFIGARARFDFGEHWAVQLRGDVGGFGAGSQFTWQAVGLIGYRFHIGNVPTTFFVGYRALEQDFQSSGFEWDMIVHGPMIGLNFVF